MKLKKYEGNPILKPNPAIQWENLVTTNPGAWYEDGKFYLLYRAAGDDKEHYIRFGLATSEDGFNFKRISDKPVFEPSVDGYDAGCVEDPRIVKFDDAFYVTYAYRPYFPGQYWTLEPGQVVQHGVPNSAPLYLKKNKTGTALAMSKDLMSFKRLGRLTKTSVDDRDVILFPEKIGGKYWMFNRPSEWFGEGFENENPAMFIASSEELMEWDNYKLFAKGEFPWESKKIGGSTPPLKTEEGWIVLYHGVDKRDDLYRVGVMLLDLEDPTKIISRPDTFIMEPEFDYETKGFYNGCVFPTGNVILGDTLYVYYGGADIYCNVATCKVSEMLDFLRKYKK